ncbi:hypothetical protein G6L37_06735 [Agrobacterium rubi]|nr:hypothetical protein [Agrobacterium rubi]NTF25060.1 hypothetical protein [Agrobacterium rubi]
MNGITLPYYERTLDSYADHIICHVRQNREGHWRAILDCGLAAGPGEPDFASHGYGASPEQAAQRCADAIRANASEIGNRAPHRHLTPGYDLKFTLMRHWAKKERFESFGFDPNQMVSVALKAPERDQWKLRSSDLIQKWDATRKLEFEFQLLMAQGLQWIREKGADTEYVCESVVEGLQRFLKDDVHPGATTDETWDIVDARIAEMLADIDPTMSMSR